MPDDHVLVLGAEHAGLGMAEEQAAGDLAVGRDHRHGEVGADGQMALGHAVVGRAVAVARVGEHVVEPDDPLARERRGEDGRVARHREPLERARAPRPRACRACTPRPRRRSRCRRTRRTARGSARARRPWRAGRSRGARAGPRSPGPTRCSASARCFSRSSRRPFSSASTRAACSRVSSSSVSIAFAAICASWTTIASSSRVNSPSLSHSSSSPRLEPSRAISGATSRGPGGAPLDPRRATPCRARRSRRARRRRRCSARRDRSRPR